MGSKNRRGANLRQDQKKQVFSVAITEKPAKATKQECDEFARFLLHVYKKKKAQTS